jgi:hypothetical protein
MQLTYDSVSDFAQALRRAEAAHGEHERQLRHPDADWPTWYAQFLVDEQTGHLDHATQAEQALRRHQVQQGVSPDSGAST